MKGTGEQTKIVQRGKDIPCVRSPRCNGSYVLCSVQNCCTEYKPLWEVKN